MVSTTIKYLARDDLYKKEKPYSAEFEFEESAGVRKSNYTLTTESVDIQAIDPLKHSFDLNTHGFCVLRAKTKLDSEDTLLRPEAVEDAYFREVIAILHSNFQEYKRIEPFEFVVGSMSVPVPWSIFA
jgi:hypothetical protein